MSHPLDPDLRDEALDAKLPRDDDDLPAVVNEVDAQQIHHMVTPLKTLEQQVGEHIVAALQSDETVAVVTTVVAGPGGQQIVSAALDPGLMQQVQQLLIDAEQNRQSEVPCVGFHCFIKPRDQTGAEAQDADEKDQ